jgi:hypothetical protein
MRLSAEDEQTEAMIEGYRAAVADLSRFSKNAVDSNVAERQLAITSGSARR